ncbi:MAG: CD225/dispanin family protein [Prevotella sp.]|nr:CD225/dispanin family protein [Prevotella sp.]
MASYYILENNQQQGPFTLDQLAARGLTPYTNVWTTGMANWVPASQVPELQQVLNRPQGFQAPPAYQGGGYQQQPPAASYGYNSGYAQQPQGGPCPKTWMVESILVTLFCCLPFGIVGIINASKVSSAHAEGRFADAQRASQDAGKWTKIGFWIGLVGIILYILLYVFIFGAAIIANS